MKSKEKFVHSSFSLTFPSLSSFYPTSSSPYPSSFSPILFLFFSYFSVSLAFSSFPIFLLTFVYLSFSLIHFYSYFTASLSFFAYQACTTMADVHTFLATLPQDPFRCVVKPVQSAGTDDGTLLLFSSPSPVCNYPSLILSRLISFHFYS